MVPTAWLHMIGWMPSAALAMNSGMTVRPASNCEAARPGTNCHCAVLWAMQSGIQTNPAWYPGLTASSSFELFQLLLHLGGHHNCPAPCDCHTVLPGESCYSAVMWAMQIGIHMNRDWYPGLTESSSFEEFQALLHLRGYHHCPAPCGCHTALPGETCHSAVTWAMQTGIRTNPEWYSGLTASSSFKQFQLVLHLDGHHNCSAPCRCHTALPGETCHTAVKWALQTGIHKNPAWYPGLTECSSFEQFQALLHSRGSHSCPSPCKESKKHSDMDSMRRPAMNSMGQPVIDSMPNPVWGWRSSGQLTGDRNWCQAEVPASDWTLKQRQSLDTKLLVRVLNYNLFWWNLFGVRRGNRMSAGRLIRRSFESEPFTVMAFQECDNVARVLSDAKLQARYIGIQSGHALSMAYDRFDWEQLHQGAADVAEDRRQQYYGRRGIQWVRLRHRQSRKTLFIVNHHGPLPIPTGGICGGRATAYNILKQIAEHAEDDDMIVLTGDFNANAHSSTFRTLRERLHWLFSGRAIGGIDHFFSNYDESHVRERSNLGSGGSDHDALSITFSI